MKIYIKGFKSIADGQYIALGKKLTFLVGPNSAGKSVVFHAMKKLQGQHPHFEFDQKSLHCNPNGDRVATTQALGLSWTDGGDELEYRSAVLDRGFYEEELDKLAGVSADPLDSHSLEDIGDRSFNLKRASFRMVSGHSVLSSVYDDAEGGVVRSKKTSYRSYIDGGFEFNQHIFLTNGTPSHKKRTLDALQWCVELLRAAKYDEDILNIRAEWGEGVFRWVPLLCLGIIEHVFKGREKQKWLNEFYHHDAALNKILKRIEDRFQKTYPGNRFQMSLVSAERVLPGSLETQACLSSFQIPENPYHELMRSFVANEWGVDWFAGYLELGKGLQYNQVTYPGLELSSVNSGRLIATLASRRSDELFSRVNHALANDLFIDNGYRISVSSTLRVSRSDFVDKEKIADSVIKKVFLDEPLIFDARMQLVDAHGRELHFSEVGSGIGYVLPVLIECFRENNAGKVVFLQQPELHLHPALQAALCDVLINAASDRMIVSETHSEHLMLRALKRIRQTFNGTLMDEGLKLVPDDVAINYFEPLSNGSTRVHILRIAPDGEFIDRWPNGFFPERDQELFDE